MVDNVQKNLNHLFDYMGNVTGPRWIFMYTHACVSSDEWIRGGDAAT